MKVGERKIVEFTLPLIFAKVKVDKFFHEIDLARGRRAAGCR